MTRLLRREDVHTEVYGAHNRRLYGTETGIGGPWIYVGTYPTDADTTPDSPPFQNGWHNQGGTLQRMRFRWLRAGGIEIQGSVAGGIIGTAIFTLPGAGEIDVTSLGSGGSGYAIDDIFVVSGGNGDAYGAVDDVSAGVVTSYHIVSGGSGYAIGTTGTTAHSGSGTGLTISIASVVYDNFFIPEKELRLAASDDLGNFIVFRVLPNGQVIGGI